MKWITVVNGIEAQWSITIYCFSDYPCKQGWNLNCRSLFRFSLLKINGEANAKEMWMAVRQLTVKLQEPAVVDGIHAESLNEYYAAISMDLNYTPPLGKHPVNPIETEYIS